MSEGLPQKKCRSTAASVPVSAGDVEVVEPWRTGSKATDGRDAVVVFQVTYDIGTKPELPQMWICYMLLHIYIYIYIYIVYTIMGYHLDMP